MLQAFTWRYKFENLMSRSLKAPSKTTCWQLRYIWSNKLKNLFRKRDGKEYGQSYSIERNLWSKFDLILLDLQLTEFRDIWQGSFKRQVLLKNLWLEVGCPNLTHPTCYFLLHLALWMLATRLSFARRKKKENVAKLSTSSLLLPMFGNE